MVEREADFLKYLKHLQSLSISSAEKYITFLRQVSEKTGERISSTTLRTEAHIENLARKIAATGMSEKSVRNYKSVMRHYIHFVQEAQNGNV
jgi:site-specific recombinase XerD